MCLVLHKVFSSIQILGLALLTIGAMLSKVNLVSCGEGPDKDCSKSRIGILIMIIMCCISSSASVANEYLLKHKDNGPLFWQNAQLYLSTCFFSVLHAAFIDQVPMNGDFFEGYSWMTLAVILNLALVGIIVSITLKHADNIVHAIASILAMILATVFSVLAMDAELHILSVFGFACIAVGVLLYFFSNACNMHCLASFYPASSIRSLV
jgi:drug/metabolite transporter (DMT)-like permease